MCGFVDVSILAFFVIFIVVKDESIAIRPAVSNSIINFEDLEDTFFVANFEVVDTSNCYWLYEKRILFFSSNTGCVENNISDGYKTYCLAKRISKNFFSITASLNVDYLVGNYIKVCVDCYLANKFCSSNLTVDGKCNLIFLTMR